MQCAQQKEHELYRCLLQLTKQQLPEALDLLLEVTESKRAYLVLYDKRKTLLWSWSRGFTNEQILAEAPKETAEEDKADTLQESLQLSIQSKNVSGTLCIESATLFTPEQEQRAEVFVHQLSLLAEKFFVQASEKEEKPRPGKYKLQGQSPAMQDVFRQIEKAARFELTVLLRGTSGTGKTAIAKAIHENSSRAKAPFLELNCATIPENLFESELFGALAGSHSTATKKTLGKIAAAEGGTLFLDEVGELPLLVQAKLLQLLQSKEYYPLGATKAEKANIRLMAATNVELEEAVKHKRFREDLLYRLQVMTIKVPSLAERRDDIPALLAFFCSQTCQLHSLEAITPSMETIYMAEISEWPGNIRQLSNAVEVATISAAMEGSSELLPKHLFPEAQNRAAERSYQEAMKKFQAHLVSRTLHEVDWNITDAAKRLRLNRSYLHQLIQSLGLRRG